MTQASKTPPDIPASPPSASFLTRLERATVDKLGDLLGIPSKPNEDKIVVLSREQEERLRQIERDAVVRFQGDIPQLEAALGMLRAGFYFGWKVLYIVHSKRTVRTYEEILGIRIRDVFPETGPSSYRSIGLNLAQRFSNFWKVAGGDIKIPHRDEMSR